MNMLNLKATLCIGISCLAVAPKAMYVASDSYIRTYNTASAYISETTENALNKVGLQTMKPEINDEDLNFLIDKHAKERGLDPRLVSALIRHESAENSDALSLKGAIGVAQIMPQNAKRCGLKKVSELWIPEKNVKCACQILDEELTTYKNDVLKALNSYNGGPKCVNPRKGADSPCAESNRHAKEVLRLFAQNFI